MRAWLLACALSLGILASGQSVHANGRFPRAVRLRESADDPAKLVLSATYGLLLTNDRGGTWRHVCELGYAFSIDDIDPLVELPPDGSLLVTAAHSLNRAESPFCDYAPVLGGAGTETVVDYALDANDRRHAVAALMRSGEGGLENALYESFDSGRTFAPFGVPLPPEVAFAVTLDLAPSEPNRIYVSAVGRNEPELLLRSDDHGASYRSFPIPVAPEEYPYLAAVDATNPDLVYVRTDYWATDEFGVATASDGLFVTTDGGQSFRELYRAPAKLFGFALSPDGREIVIGYGDPAESSRLVDPSALGIYRASTADYVFTKIYEGSVSCLAWTATGLYACTSQSERGFALGLSPNADFSLAEAEPFTPLLDLEKVAGPLACPDGTSAAVCAERWPETCTVLGACDAGTAGTGGAGMAGAAGDGSPGSAGTSASTDDSERGCGCRSAGSPGSAAALGFGVLAAALSYVRRRRARGAGTRSRAARDR